MNYRIPPEEILSEVIKGILNDRSVINSQKALSKYVNDVLKSMNPEYTATEGRIRRTLINNALGKIEIHARESDERSKAGRCPVCSSKMIRIRNQTIFGGTVTLGYKCLKCPYWTGIRKRVPIRYIFFGKM